MKRYHKLLALILSVLLSISSQSPSLAFIPVKTLNGLAHYQGRLAHEGITIHLLHDLISTTTDTSEQFHLSGLNDGAYWLRVEAGFYLAHQLKVTVIKGEPQLPLSITLYGGDLNGDDSIDIADATLLGANFGQSAPQVDINADGRINVQDLSIVGGNLGKTTPPAGNDEGGPRLYLPLIRGSDTFEYGIE